MKANDGSGNNIDRDEWETPQELFDLLNLQYRFEFDCCATTENKKTILSSNGNFIECGIKKSCCWMNPPFSKARIMFEHFFLVVRKGVAIYRCDNFETKIWQQLIFPCADWIFIPNGRVNYVGMNGNGSRFPSALIGVGVEPPKYIEGVCLTQEDEGER